MCASVFLVSTICLATPSPAAASTVTPSPDPAPDTAPPAPSPTPDRAQPVIISPAAGALVGDRIPFEGTAEPGSGIDLYASTGGQPLCSVVASSSGSWTCVATLASANSVSVRAVQTVGSDTRESTVQLSVLNAPTATAGGGGSVSSGTVMGSAYPGATVTAVVSGDSGDSVSCTSTVEQDGSWFCLLPRGIASGTYSLTASQVAPWSGGRSSALSAPSTLTIDVDAPAPPGVSVPTGSPVAPGASFSGEGETGATVTVFAGPHTLCQAVVAGGRWSCTASAIEAGTYDVSAIQQDAAGNISAGSARTRITFGTADASTTPAPPTTDRAAPDPVATSTSSPALPSGGDPDIVVPGSTGAAPQAAPLAPAPAAAGGWSAATRFSSAMQPVFGRTGSIDWAASVVIGLAIVTLLAIPARLLGGALRTIGGPPTAAARRGRIAGRNRSRQEEFEVAPTLPWNARLSAAFALLASAAISVLSAPVSDQPAYVRLLVAVTLGILTVNAVAVVVPRLLSRWMFDASVGLRLKPSYLLVSIGATVLSRVLDLDPALIFGLVATLALADTASKRARGRLAAVQVAGLSVLGVTALLVSGTMPPSSDAIGAFGSEFVNTLALSALGSAAIVMLPVADMPGRHILRWQPFVWLCLAALSFTLVGGILARSLGGLGGGAAIIMIGLAALLFAGVCVAIWIWARFVHRPTG
ncbi:conserved membrane protein of unknown function [Agreia sp. COWG]|nr:conserved membrane protein of unknown function [Agreia sp. COWG]